MENPHTGDRVRLRRQPWTIVETQPYDGCQLLTLEGIGAHNAASVRRVLTPFDAVDPMVATERPHRVSMRRWRRLLTAALDRHGPWTRLHTAASAAIDLLPFQLEPTLALLKGLGARLLLADDVGLGKTVQAGLAIAELMARGVVERVLVITPAGLREQWAGELIRSFHLDPIVVDMATLRRQTARLPVGMNPWSSFTIAISSIDFVKRPEVVPAVAACHWDMVVIDEAHGVVAGTDRARAMGTICKRAGYVLALTATPHNGDHRAFLSLCNLGAHGGDPVLVFRRTRRDASLALERRVRRLMVRPSAAESRMHALLERLAHAVRNRPDGPDDAHERAWLTLGVLHKRAFSSPYALGQSVRRRLASLATGESPGAQQLLLPMSDEGGELDVADEPPALLVPLLNDAARERRLLEALEAAAAAAVRSESKLACLRRLLRRLERRGEPIIVFTEYRDTLLHIRRAIDVSCAVLHGGLSRGERRNALDEFTSGRSLVLLATDAAGEGLNLQQRCRTVVNLELPWNPMRLEQRIGRVDRIGQKRRVHAIHLIADGTHETRMLRRLAERVSRAHKDVGAADPLGGLAPSTSIVEGAGDAEGCAWRSLLEDAPTEPIANGPSPAVGDAMRLITLPSEGAAEYSRATAARLNGGYVAPPSGTRVSWSRTLRRRFRLLLGSHTLVVVETRCDDGCGRIIASHLTPIVTTLTRKQLQSGCAVSVDVDHLVSLDSTLVEWRDQTLRAHAAFWQARRDRELGIGRIVLNEAVSAFQPGLFDRRADRRHVVLADEEREWQSDHDRRLQRISASAVATAPTARVVLVVFTLGPA